MLSRARACRPPSSVRSITIPIPTSGPRASSSKEVLDDDVNRHHRKPDEIKNEDPWESILRNVPRVLDKRSLDSARRRSLDTDFFSSARRPGQSRKYSTAANSGSSEGNTSEPAPPRKPISDDPNSIFNTNERAWTHLFQNIDDQPPLSSMPISSTRRPNATSSGRRMAMTNSESHIFEQLFSMLFQSSHDQNKANAAEGVKGRQTNLMMDMDRQSLDVRAARAQDPLSGVGIGRGPEGLEPKDHLFGWARRSLGYRWGKEEDKILTQKMADMELCETDAQLLEWAAREVFDDMTRYEEMTREQFAKQNLKGSQGKSAETASASKSSPSPTILKLPVYAHLIAGLMRTFRDKFNDPYIALSIFHHARTRSVASAVFGCTGPAYTELLRTRWYALHDLRGVASALAEMRANGVVPEGSVRTLVDEIRRNVGERTIWSEERGLGVGEEGSGEVLALLERIEELSRERVNLGLLKKGRSTKNDERHWRTTTAERWKTGGFSKGEYRFNDWSGGDRDSPSSRSSRSRTRGRGRGRGRG